MTRSNDVAVECGEEVDDDDSLHPCRFLLLGEHGRQGGVGGVVGGAQGGLELWM
jgi:hypothetical protein